MAKIVLIESDTVTTGDIDLHEFPVLTNAAVLNSNDVSLLYDKHPDAEILFLNKLNITKSVLDRLPALKYIQIMATGYDNVDLEACRSRGIHVSNVSGYSTYSVAQHVFALILELSNKVHYHWQLSREGIWANEPKFCFYAPGLTELFGKKLGIIGMGSIGKAVANIGLAFGMEVVTYTRSPHKIENPSIQAVELEELIGQSDVISLHTPLTQDTSELVNESFLSAMKKSAILINTARGGLINESDLFEALKGQQIKGAALDVLNQEPPEENHPLFTLSNCVITSHMAWATIDARKRLLKTATNQVSNFTKGIDQEGNLV